MRFKHLKDLKRFYLMHPIAQQIAYDMIEWSETKYNIELTITSTFSTKEEDEILKRRTSTHRTGRAFDISVDGLSSNFIDELSSYFSEKYKGLGAVNEDGEESLIVTKPHGTAPHIHVQIHSKYAFKED